MDDTRVRDGLVRGPDGPDTIESFATRVLAVLAARSRRTSGALRADLVEALADCMITQDETRIQRTLTDFRRFCISPPAMVDLYVPAAARQLGEAWVDDGMDFAGVTIATARLQALARAISGHPAPEPLQGGALRSVLMIVPEGEDHTLGAIVATDQMRRIGLSVCLRLGPTAKEVAALLRLRDFDAAMLSLGCGERLDKSRKLVDTIRSCGPAELPVVVGGAALRAGKDVVSLTGADYATADAVDALGFCGLMPAVPAADGGAEQHGAVLPR